MCGPLVVVSLDPGSVVGHLAALRHHREPAVVPQRQSPAQRPRVPARGPEGLRRQRRPRAQAAREDDRPVARDGVGLRGQALHLDVARGLDAARLPLVGLAYVDEDDVAGVHPLDKLLGLDLQLRRAEGHHPASLPYRSRAETTVAPGGAVNVWPRTRRTTSVRRPTRNTTRPPLARTGRYVRSTFSWAAG